MNTLYYFSMLEDIQPEGISILAKCLGWPFAVILLQLCKSQTTNQALATIIRRSAKKLGVPFPNAEENANQLLRLVWQRAGFADLKQLRTARYSLDPGVRVAVDGVFGNFSPDGVPVYPSWEDFPHGCQWMMFHSSRVCSFNLTWWEDGPRPRHEMRCQRDVLRAVCHGWNIEVSCQNNTVFRIEVSPSPAPERSPTPDTSDS